MAPGLRYWHIFERFRVQEPTSSAPQQQPGEASGMEIPTPADPAGGRLHAVAITVPIAPLELRAVEVGVRRQEVVNGQPMIEIGYGGGGGFCQHPMSESFRLLPCPGAELAVYLNLPREYLHGGTVHPVHTSRRLPAKPTPLVLRPHHVRVHPPIPLPNRDRTFYNPGHRLRQRGANLLIFSAWPECCSSLLASQRQ